MDQHKRVSCRPVVPKVLTLWTSWGRWSTPCACVYVWRDGGALIWVKVQRGCVWGVHVGVSEICLCGSVRLRPLTSIRPWTGDWGPLHLDCWHWCYVQDALCYVKLGILFHTGNICTVLCFIIRPWLSILNCGYRSTWSHIQKHIRSNLMANNFLNYQITI